MTETSNAHTIRDRNRIDVLVYDRDIYVYDREVLVYDREVVVYDREAS